MTPSVHIADSLVAGAAQAARRASDAMLGLQHEQGYWWAELTADTTLESDYILLQLWLHPPVDGNWNPPNRAQVDRAAHSILSRQLPDGGFNIYPQGPPEISASVKAYFSLKIAGLDENSGEMSRLRERILALGGIQAANSYVKINLSFFGLYPREAIPAIPPEMMLLPGKFIYQMSSWTRAIVIPLSIVHAHNPCRPLPAGFHIDELFVPGVPLGFERDKKLFTWRNTFLFFDKVCKLWEKHGSKALRAHAIKKAERWMLERTRYSDGLAAIYPPMQYVIMALELLGHDRNHANCEEAEKQFNALMVDDGRRFFFQPCFSVVWDTAIAGFAMGESGMAPLAAMQKCGD